MFTLVSLETEPQPLITPISNVVIRSQNPRNWLTVVTALAFAVLYAGLISYNGLAKYFQVEAGGVRYDDFPRGGFSPLRLAVIVSYSALHVCFAVWLWRSWSIPRQVGFARILLRASPFLVIAFLTYPFSDDIYQYLHYGRMAVSGVNPYLTPPEAFASEYSRLLAWKTTSTYGPISLAFFSASALAGALHPLCGVYAFKLICLAAHVLNAGVLWRLTAASERRGALTLAYLLHPLLLAEHVASAHVDVLLASVLVALFASILNGHWTRAVVWIWAGVLTKTLPLIWMPLLGLYLIRTRRWRVILAGAGVSVLVIGTLALSVLPEPAAWSGLMNPAVAGKTARSFHHMLKIILGMTTPGTMVPWVDFFTKASQVGFCVYFLFVLARQFRNDYTPRHLLEDLGWTALVLFLFATPWVMPWYPSVLLTIVVLLWGGSRRFVATALAFCVVSGLIVGAGAGRSAISLLTAACSTLPPVLVMVWGWKRLPRENSAST